MADPRRAARAKHDRPRGATAGAPEAVRVRMLGGFSVSVGSRTIAEGEWRLRRAAGLVKLLALEPGHRMHRERVMDLLWPEQGVGRVAGKLRYALHVARRVMDPAPAGASSHYLRLRGEQLVLCPEGPLWVDVEAFEEAAARARRSREPMAYEAARDLYAGDLLPQDLYEQWAEDRRAQLRRDYLELLLELARLYEGRGEYEPAIGALRAAVSEEAANEEAHAGLMRLYAACGRRRAALGQYERLVDVLARELSAEPGEGSRRLHEEIVAGRFPPPGGPPRAHPPETGRHNLPAERSSFVGREREILETKRELAMTRLLTLTGAGGCGKTRLALAVAAELAGAYPDGVWLVELAPLSEGALVPQAAAEALGAREQPGRPLAATLADHLGDKEALLVLDNCEHLVEAAARLVDALLSSCPRLRVLATSREALRASGEAVRRVPSLSLPGPGEETVEGLARSEAARLFVERARSRAPGFDLTERDARAVARTCRRLDGVPLAIELAAARAGTLSVRQIAERLDDSLGLLKGGDRTAIARHRTLRGTLDWSHALLDEPEKKLFGRLSAFAGGWTLEAAETVGAGGDIERDDVLDLLSGLVDKSMVVVEASADGHSRYRMLEPVRQYALERLERSGEADAVRRRHAHFFLALAEEAEPQLRGPEQEAWLGRLEAEHGNLRAALGWMLERGEDGPSLRMGGAMGEFWYTRGYHDEGRRWLEAVLANGGLSPASARVKVLTRAGYIAGDQGDYERAAALGEEGLALSRRSGNRAGAAAALHTLGTVALHRNECEEAAALLQEALALRRSMGDTMGAGRVLQALGVTAAIRGDFERAVALHEEGLPLAREMGDRLGIALFLGQGALAYLGRGDHRRADALCAEGIELSRQLGHEYTLIFVLHIAAAVLAGSRGQPKRAARLWGAAEALREAAGATLSRAARHYYGPYVDAARAQLDDETAWEAACAQGEAMTFEEAIEYALSAEEEVDASQTSWREEGSSERKLTSRESEVAALVSRGLTNRQIASELVISERTVNAHLRKVFEKLKLHSRAQLAAWATEQGLPR